ncbi:MAG: glycosyltransferase [Gemmatimonadota bacterium]|nr:glycosyltransferase [Gemmatimonadota bacterium]
MSGSAISVVVLPFSGRDGLIRCLDGLQHQTGTSDVEVLVPHDDTLPNTAALTARFPGVTFVPFSGRRTPAELRAKGVAATRGEIVALLEDHCTPEPDWCARMLAWHAEPHAAVGGAVEKGFPPGMRSDSALNWAVYLTDYSRYMNPMPAAPTISVTDTNSSYKRSELDGIHDAWAEEFHENVVNERLRARGRSLWFAPDVIVREQRTLTLGAALRDRYGFGRLFASTRVADAPLSRRLILAAASTVMPPVLLMRVAQNLFRRGRHRGQFLRCLPQLVVVTSVWMGGEMVGYLTARPVARRPGTAHGT